jgi:hypothetical protein
MKYKILFIKEEFESFDAVVKEAAFMDLALRDWGITSNVGWTILRNSEASKKYWSENW